MKTSYHLMEAPTVSSYGTWVYFPIDHDRVKAWLAAHAPHLVKHDAPEAQRACAMLMGREVGPFLQAKAMEVGDEALVYDTKKHSFGILTLMFKEH